MSRAGQPFIAIEQPKDVKPRLPVLAGVGLGTTIKDQLSIEVWLCLGALLQGALFLVAGRVSLVPAVALVLYKILNTYAQVVGWTHNQAMDGVAVKKFAASFPKEDGSFDSVPCNDDVTVFLLGTRANHPMGILAPGFKELGDYYTEMVKDLEKDGYDKFGFLGATQWLNASDHKSNNETMTVMYFKTPEGLHEFAHSPVHRKGWDWWNRNVKSHPHISIWHETYHVPKGHWESIYINSSPVGINSLNFKVYDKETGTAKWQSPAVDASKGLLKTSAGRMSRSKGTEHDKYGEDPYDKY